MAYRRTQWVSRQTPLSAENFNNIEEGIAEAKTAARGNETLWTYIMNKISSVLGLTASQYGGNASTVNGHTVNADVPAGAKFTDTTYADATTSNHGLMSAADKVKLNGIAAGAEVNQNAFSNVKVGSTNVAADGKSDTLELVAGSNVSLTPDATNDKVTINAVDTTYGVVSKTANGLAPKLPNETAVVKYLRQDGSWSIPPNTTYSAATTSTAGLMSAADKTKLNGIATGAEVNQNAFSNVKVGGTTIVADDKKDTLELVAGSNVTLTPDAVGDKVVIAATDTTYSTATTSSKGLMSASDKTKLNGISTNANNLKVSDMLEQNVTLAAGARVDFTNQSVPSTVVGVAFAFASNDVDVVGTQAAASRVRIILHNPGTALVTCTVRYAYLYVE